MNGSSNVVNVLRHARVQPGAKYLRVISQYLRNKLVQVAPYK